MTMNTWPGWQNVGLIGEGSFGKVFRIRREEFGRAYEAALKVISIPQNSGDIQAAYAEGMDDKSVTEYFRSCVEDIVAEFALMSQLKGNTNIVSYEDHMVVQHEDGIGWDILIRMELLTPLMSYVRNHPLGEEGVIQLGIDMARALKLCRKKGILHRDIKPENIFVSDDGDFKLGDFGVARVAEKTVSAMSKKGTYTYMAPEVYKGEKYGFAADLYSLGIVLYRFLNDNRLPYMPPAPQPIQFRDRERALNARVMGNPMPEPTHGDAALKAVVMKTCAYAPADRYASAEELEQALAALQKPAVALEKETYENIFIPAFTKEQMEEKDPLYLQGLRRVEETKEDDREDDDDWEDDDDFEKTVSSLSMSRPVKKDRPVEEPAYDRGPDLSMYELDSSSAEKTDRWDEKDDWEDDEDDWDDEDDFEKTVSSFSGFRVPKKAEPERPASRSEEREDSVPSFGMKNMSLRDLEEMEKHGWEDKQFEADEHGWDDDDDWEDDDDFEKTVSSLSMSRPAKKPAEKPAFDRSQDLSMYEMDSHSNEKENRGNEDDDWDEDDDEFDKTVSTFSARKPVRKQAKPEPEPVEEVDDDWDEDDDEFDRTVSTFSTRPVRKPVETPKPSVKPVEAKKTQAPVEEKSKPKGLFARLFGKKR